MTNTPPVEFATIGLHGEFKKQDEKSWRGPCPTCGGTRRYAIFTDNEYPLWHGWCDGCGRRDKFWEHHHADKVLTDSEIIKRRDADRREELERAQYRADKLKAFSSGELWAELHTRMGEQQRAWWLTQGITTDWQDFLELGWVSDKTYRSGGSLCHSEAYTIPYFHYCGEKKGKNFVTMQYRLANAPTADRYRFEYNMTAEYYNVTPNVPIGDKVLICEGAKKAIVARIYVSNDMTVLAVPSKSSSRWFGLPQELSKCGLVYICLDPDAGDSALTLAKAIGKQSRVVNLFDKLDDLILKHELRGRDFNAYLRQAVPL